MLKFGEEVKIGEDTYKVMHTADPIVCRSCELQCSNSRAFEKLKASHNVSFCVRLLPKEACFKKVESAPQVAE